MTEPRDCDARNVPDIEGVLQNRDGMISVKSIGGYVLEFNDVVMRSHDFP